ncbi:hypothetical protein [Candidatus Entotheonella palauensis]|uniref:Uncharacterized protein n=1 Tax=Candidatus Entotheonella gemina TaxID=1429439 RepID=W4LXP8_9BACT|nr:hypothetical protein [Candidatus Entotheonella palauensis]ETX02526.1 MAG: hypothetical protein ETSY2_35395 [Candidatus Entotheonella gemina]
MKTQLNLIGDAKTLDALSRFLYALENALPAPVTQPKAICGADNVIYVEVGYQTEEETFIVGDLLAEVGAQIVEDSNVLVALAPFVTTSKTSEQS